MENSSINVNFEPVENEKDQEAVIEAVLFTIGGAVELRQLAAAIGQDKETAKRAVERLAKRYRQETRGMEIKQLEDSYQMCTRSEYYENLIRVWQRLKSRCCPMWFWKHCLLLLTGSR